MTDAPIVDDSFLPIAYSMYTNPGAYAVLAGAGISMGAGIPTAWAIVVDLINEIARHVGAPEAGKLTVHTAEAWYENQYGSKPTYSQVVEKLAKKPHERESLLKQYIEGDKDGDEQIQPSKAHRAVARLMKAGVVRVVMTMNFDRLFERALIEEGIDPVVVSTDAAAKGLRPLHTVDYCVIHLHGDYRDATSMLNTDQELRGYGPDMQRVLERVLTDYGLIVVGWSVQHDHALRKAVMAHSGNHFSTGWIEPGLMTDSAKQLVESKQATVFQTTADEALGRIADSVIGMSEKFARHPLTLSIAASRIKRHLTNQAPAISAHDMLASELRRLGESEALRFRDLNDHSDETYIRLVNLAIEACRVPAACAAVLAYWGDETTDEWWLPELERLTQLPRSSGVTRIIRLPLVAACRLFYSVGIAAIAGRRYDLAAELMKMSARELGYNQPAPLLKILDWRTVHADASFLGERRGNEALAADLAEVLTLTPERIDDAWQRFELLRTLTQILESPGFDNLVRKHQMWDEAFKKKQELGENTTEAWQKRDEAIGEAMRLTTVYRPHLRVEDVPNSGTGLEWSCSSIADKLCSDIQDLPEIYPQAIPVELRKDALALAKQGAIWWFNKQGKDLEWQTGPAYALWLDRGAKQQAD